MKDPAIQKKMREYGIPIPSEEDGGGDNIGDEYAGLPYHSNIGFVPYKQLLL